MSDTNKKEYNLRIAPLRKTRSGFMSRVVDEKLLEALKAAELGGRFFITVRDGEDENGQPTQFGYLEYATKERVQAFNATQGKTAFSKTAALKKKQQAESEEI